jgi:hypothetical protein
LRDDTHKRHEAEDMRYQDMIHALLDPAAYPHGTGEIGHLHTHISEIFLAGDYAYKVKKPVDLGFLDFTTRDKRLRACRDEVRLNARLAPQIYLGVCAICLQDGRYRIVDEDGCAQRGEVADYAVRMRRMPQEGMLDQVAGAGRLTREQMQAIAVQLARFHRSAERGPHIDAFGTPAYVARPIRQNFSQTEKFIGDCLSRAQFERLRDYSESFLRTHAGLFEERIAARHIVDGHGDLHLRNMCWYHDEVVIFDCIEFNQALRAGDTLNDIAFLTMDLDARGLTPLGNEFLNTYLEQTGDYRGVALLDFYQVYRACVRGKVAAFLLDAADSEAERSGARREAAAYFTLAERYVTPRKPGLIITCGLSGSGKSTIARQVAESLDGIQVRSDNLRKQLAGMAPEQRDESAFAQGIYHPQMTQRTYDAMLQHARVITGSGRWAILDATYPTPQHRSGAAGMARALGLPYAILYCSAPRAELLRRLAARSAAGTDVSDATGAILQAQAQHFEAPGANEGLILDWSGTENIADLLAPLVR